MCGSAAAAARSSSDLERDMHQSDIRLDLLAAMCGECLWSGVHSGMRERQLDCQRKLHT